MKLQCLLRALCDPSDLRAHRALDDCIALRHVMSCTAERLGVGLLDLLRLFTVVLDEPASYVQVCAILEDQMALEIMSALCVVGTVLLTLLFLIVFATGSDLEHF